jgi:hypothetical protein
MWTGRFKKFLEVVFGRPSLPLDVTFGSHYEPLVTAVGFLTAVFVASHYSNAMESALFPLLAALRVFPNAFDGGLGGSSLAAAGGRSHVT